MSLINKAGPVIHYGQLFAGFAAWHTHHSLPGEAHVGNSHDTMQQLQWEAFHRCQSMSSQEAACSGTSYKTQQHQADHSCSKTNGRLPIGQQAQCLKQPITELPAEAPTAPTSEVPPATNHRSYAGTASLSPGHANRRLKPQNPARQQKFTSIPAVPAPSTNRKTTPATSKPSSSSTPKVPVTTEEETEITEIFRHAGNALCPVLKVLESYFKNSVLNII